MHILQIYKLTVRFGSELIICHRAFVGILVVNLVWPV